MQRFGPFNHGRQTFFGTLTLVAVLLGVAAPGRAFANNPGKTGYPNSIASTGDSITRAFETSPVPYTDAPYNSWSTGINGAGYSHYGHILAANRLIEHNTYNDAVTGAMMSALSGQVANVINQHVEYVTILMGGNDFCTDTPQTMTSITAFRTQFTTAMNTLTTGLPDARIFVVSIPDAYQLWADFHTTPAARLIWAAGTICQALLTNPLSLAPADAARRAFVRQRNSEFNIELEQVCAQYIHCRSDHNAVFKTHFAANEVSTRDYFHPSELGQTMLGNNSYATSFDFTDKVAPVSNATSSPVNGGLRVTIRATDNVGVRGIEWRMGTSGYTRYIGPVTVLHGSTLYFRAVDVNGNIEAEQAITAR